MVNEFYLSGSAFGAKKMLEADRPEVRTPSNEKHSSPRVRTS